MDEALAFPPPGRAVERGLAGPARRLRARSDTRQAGIYVGSR